MRCIDEWTGTSALAAILFIGAAGCGERGTDNPETWLPARVGVSLIDATTGVGTMDGRQWDGFGQIPEDVLNSVAGVLARRNPYVAIGSVLAPLATGLFEKPDPTGLAELLNGVTTVGRVELKANQEDTFSPRWQDAQGKAPSFTNVPLNASTRIRVQLMDKDIPSDELMGVCEINDRDLIEALQAQQVHQVNVADQTKNQILFLGISVVPEE